MAEFGPRRLLVESLPLAALVALWGVPAELVGGGLAATAVRLAGVAMAAAYALVRSRYLADAPGADALSLAPGSLVRANVTPAVACLGWVLAGRLLEALTRLLVLTAVPAGLPRRFEPLLDGVADLLAFGGAATGLLSVLLYAAVLVRLHATDAATPRPRTRS